MQMTFNVPTIACSGCADAITKAIQTADSKANISVDVDNKMVEVNTELSDASIRQVIVDAGHEIAA